MEWLRDVLNGPWVGSYSYEGRYQIHRTEIRFELSSQINQATGKPEITGRGNHFTGDFKFEGAATSATEIAMTQLIGVANNWWHTATVDLDRREMRGSWGPAWLPNKVDGSLIFQRQMTQKEERQEAEAAKRASEEARRKQEEAAAVAARKTQEEEAARKQQEAADEVARKKQQEENEEAATKQRDEAAAARKRAEEAEAARKKQEDQAEKARKQREDDERARQKETENASQKQDNAEKITLGPQQTVQTANETDNKPAVSIADSDDGVAGNLKVYLKLDLDVDIRVIAALKGDVAIGIM